MCKSICIGGIPLVLRPAPPDLLPLPAESPFRRFCFQPLPGLDDNPFTISAYPLTESGPVFNPGDRVWSAWEGTDVFRSGDKWTITTFKDKGAGSLPEWVTTFQVEDETCATWSEWSMGADGVLRCPGLDRYRHLCCLLPWLLASRNGLWLHAAAARYRNKSFLFLGRSGKGKSTLSGLLNESGAFEVASDEKTVVRMHHGEFYAFGTPWTSAARLAANLAAPLGGIFFLDHAPQNEWIRMGAGAAAKKMLPQLHVPWFDENMSARVLECMATLMARVPSWTFGFRPDQHAVDDVKRLLDDL